MKKQAIAGLGLIVVAGVGCGLGLMLTEEPTPAPTLVASAGRQQAPRAERRQVAAPSETQAAPAANSVLAPGRLEREAGHQTESSVSFWGRLSEGDASEEQLLLEMRGRGHLISTCYEATASELFLAQRIVMNRFESVGLRDDEAAALRDELAAGVEVLLKVDRQGRVLALSLEQVRGRQARNFLRSWLRSQALHLGGASSWTSPGIDPMGRFEDTYVTQGAEGEAVQLRRTRRYLPNQAQNPLASGEVDALVRADGLTLSLRGKEAVGVGGGDTRSAPIRYLREQELDFVAERSLSADELGQARLAHNTPEWESGLELETERAPQAEARPTAELLQEEKPSFLALRRRLLEHESELELVLARILDPNAPLATRRSLVDVLGEVHTPAAQRALLQVAKSELPEGLLPNVFLSLGQAPKPLAEVVIYFEASLEGEPGERTGWAIQGAGLLASLAADLETQEQLATALEGRLGKSTQDGLVLSALGNAGLERSFDRIGEFLAADEPSVRSQAVFALRNQHSEEALQSLGQVLSEDPEPTVRKAALRALAYRAAEPSAPLVQAALEDADVTVRLEAIRTLGAWLSPEAEGELDDELNVHLQGVLQRAQLDADPAVREAAGELQQG